MGGTESSEREGGDLARESLKLGPHKRMVGGSRGKDGVRRDGGRGCGSRVSRAGSALKEGGGSQGKDGV